MRHFYLFILVLALYAPKLSAQTTITTALPASYTFLSGASGVTFVIQNTNAYDVTMTAVSMHRNTASTSATYTLWMSATSLSGSGAVQAPAWQQMAQVNAPNVSTTAIHPIFSGLSINIPANSTRRFCVQSSNRTDYASSNTASFSSGGISLHTGNYQISGSNVGYAGSGTTVNLANNPRYFIGSVTFAPACATPSGMLASNVDNNSADISWNAIAGSQGYEYVLSLSATPPTGSGTLISNPNHTFNNLANGTTYYVHVRNKCSSTSFSSWATISFATIGCHKPTNLLISNITDTSADVVWSVMPGIDHYEYKLSFSNQPPTTGIIQTNSFAHHFTDLQANSKYYLHLRSRCFGTDSSTWRVDSFVTQMACYAPNVHVNLLGTNNPYAYWDAVPNAWGYEYTMTNNTNSPAFGQKTGATNAQLHLPEDGKPYYLFVRCQCNSMFTFSPWTMTMLRAAGPTNIGAVNSVSLEIYPNPAGDNLVISGVNTGDYIVTDITGSSLLRGNIHANKTTINTSGLAPAVYLLKVKHNGQETITRFMKQ